MNYFRTYHNGLYTNRPKCNCRRHPVHYHCGTYNNFMNEQNNIVRWSDQGKKPYVVNINGAAKRNNTFRTAIWTGNYFQVTLMSIAIGDDIGLEVHPDVDQFLRIEEGEGLVEMGDKENNLSFRRRVSDDDAIIVPARMWHNLTNTGNIPIKLYSIYAPPEHPFGTVHRTKADEMATE